LCRITGAFVLIILIYLKGRSCITRSFYIWTERDCWNFDISWSRS